jgi:prepilin-type N-terminal cleavage/methylation domain-containing protein
MKLPLIFRRKRNQAMTLSEVMVASAIFGLALTGFLAMHFFGLRSEQLVRLTLQECDDARRTVGKMAADIRVGGTIRVGNGSATSFTETTFGQLQQGNAIEIYPFKGNTNDFVRFYRDDSDSLLKRYEKNLGTMTVLAHSVTNVNVFTSEDSFGNVLTNNFNNRVVGVFLQFYEPVYPYTQSGKQARYNYFQIRTKVTRRALE